MGELGEIVPRCRPRRTSTSCTMPTGLVEPLVRGTCEMPLSHRSRRRPCPSLLAVMIGFERSSMSSRTEALRAQEAVHLHPLIGEVLGDIPRARVGQDADDFLARAHVLGEVAGDAPCRPSLPPQKSPLRVSLRAIVKHS